MPRVGRKSVRQAARASKGVPSKSTKIIEEWIDQHQVASTPANMKWAWEILDGKGSSSLCGHDVIAGWRYGGSLGIYQDKQDRWCITHLPTGWGLDGCFSKSREEVERILFGVRGFIDWEFAHPNAYKILPQKTKSFIEAMRDYCLGRATAKQVALLVKRIEGITNSRGKGKRGADNEEPEEIELGQQLQMGSL
tara:strand:+ start:983 stop:1564 length:582 start_codon:yes stop_codon:yes gene_type:complete